MYLHDREWLQVHNQDALELIHYSCSQRVIPVGTAHLNARRLVRMLRQPIIGLTSRQLWDFGCDARVRTSAHCTVWCCHVSAIARLPCAPLTILPGSLTATAHETVGLHTGAQLPTKVPSI